VITAVRRQTDRLYIQEQVIREVKSQTLQTVPSITSHNGSHKTDRQTVLYIKEKVTMAIRRQRDRLYVKEQVVIEDRRQTDILYLQEPVIIAVGRQTDKCTEASRTRKNGSQKTNKHTEL
jgi:hypothetical protein